MSVSSFCLNGLFLLSKGLKKNKNTLDIKANVLCILKGREREALSLYNCCCLVAQSCPTLCYPMDCSPPDPSVHEISQARILEWILFPSLGDLPDQRIEPKSPTLPRWHSVNNSPANAGGAEDAGFIPGLGRSPGEWKGYPLQYSGLENPRTV